MAESQRALVSRFRRHHVGRANLLFHLARRPIHKAREKSRFERARFKSLDGAQRRFLHRRETKIAGCGAGAGPLVSLGSVRDVAGRRNSPRPCVLPRRRTHRSGCCGHFEASRDCDRSWCDGGRWLIYGLAVRSSLGKSQAAFAGFALVMTAAAAWGLAHVFSGRAAYIHLGAIFGTIMTINVWMRILPAQHKMIAAAAAGETFDASLGAQAKLRSKHNTFMAVPVVFLMLSNHYPVATYGSRYGWEIMLALIVAGWGAAKLIREF